MMLVSIRKHDENNKMIQLSILQISNGLWFSVNHASAIAVAEEKQVFRAKNLYTRMRYVL